MTAVNLPKDHCPHCLHELDAATNASNPADETGPREDDFSYCLYCAGMMVMQGGMWVIPLPVELQGLPIGQLLMLARAKAVVVSVIDEREAGRRRL